MLNPFTKKLLKKVQNLRRSALEEIRYTRSFFRLRGFKHIKHRYKRYLIYKVK